MTVSEYIFNFIQQKGCTTVYMVSGSSAMWLTDSLCRNKDLQAVCCHHEQAAAMAADGYGRVHNDIPGCCLVTIGPGATNAITGVAQAYLDSSPMFVLSGQANSRLLDYEIKTGIRQHGTQSLNLEPIVSPITKYFAAVMRPEDIKMHMEQAYYQAMSGRKGPVWIDVPVDIQNRQVPEEMEGFLTPAEKMARSIDYQKIAQLIAGAKKPLILAGYGVRCGQAVAELKELSSRIQAPIVTSRGGIDVIDSDSEWFVGRPGAYGDRASHFAIQQCDLLLILGSRLSISTIGYYPQRLAENAVKIMIDIDEKELAKEDVPVDYKYHIDVKTFITALLENLTDSVPEERRQWKAHCTEMRMKYPNVKPEYQKETPLNEYWVTKKLSDLADGQANIVVDTGSVCNIVSQSWRLKEGQRYLISGGLSCMGFWATAIGAFQQGKQLIAITGDGSAQMNIQELATLSYNKIPVKLFIYNNNGYMLIRHNQHNYMDDRFLGVGPDSGLQTPDFCRVAEAYNVKAVQITKEEELERKIQEVLEEEEPVVCEIMVQEFAPIEPRIASKVMPDGSLKAAEFDDLYPFL
ncbi:MAG: thiamine pyrophosphate-binding protein [Lachnospiraceae bacterium]|nr:thiamine pyrophosphate-binding protein [Lachnospiraceae bacterium]